MGVTLIDKEMDTVDFVENVYGIKLLEPQKLLLRKIHDLYKAGYKPVWCCGRFRLVPIEKGVD